MADLDSLMNRKITIFTHDDTEYQGILFNINTKEHSLVLRNVTISKGKVKQNAEPHPFVSFPGNEIKDLFMDDDQTETTTSPAVPTAAAVAQQTTATTSSESKPPAAANGDNKSAAVTSTQRDNSRQNNNNSNNSSNNNSNNNNRKPAAAPAAAPDTTVFDIAHYSQRSQQFNKVEAFADLKKNPVEVAKYNFDDFFDNLGVSADASKGRAHGYEEKKLNVETFGSAGVSNNYHGHGRGYWGGRGGRGGGRNYNNNNSNNNNNNNNRNRYNNRPQYQSQFANNREHAGVNPKASSAKVGGGSAAVKDAPK